MADSTAQWAAPGPSAPPTRPQSLGAPPVPPPAQAPVQPTASSDTAQSFASPATQAEQRAKSGRRSGTRPIPLRPLSVLEVMDAGVGALRSIPRRVHLLVAAISIGIGLLGLGTLLYIQHQVDNAVIHGSYTSTDFFGDTTVYEGVASGTTNFGRFLLDVLFAIVFSGLAVTIATGFYATSTQRYIDARPTDFAAAEAGYRGQRVKLVWLALIVALPRLILLGLAVILTLDSANDPSNGAAPVFWWLVLLGLPACFLSSSILGVAAPALVLERVGIRKALGRSTRLTTSGHWRTGWTSFFTLVMTQSPLLLLVVYLFFIRLQESGNGSFASMFSILDLILVPCVVIGSVPLRATTAAMLYVDRRFRREGLDVRIAWARVAKEAL